MEGTEAARDIECMILVAVLLTASINIEIDLGALFRAHARKTPQATCGISTVGYRFTGQPGQKFRYAGNTYTVPIEGQIELIADRRRATYAIGGKSVRIEESPHDQFGFRTVELPPIHVEGDRP